MAALTTWFRGTWFIKDFVVKYLNYIFYANSKGQLQFYDGTKNYVFSNKPYSVKEGSWTTRPELPFVTVGDATGAMEYVSFSRDLLRNDTEVVDSTTVNEIKSYGGDFNVSLDIEIWANTGEERDRLTDVVCVFLSHPDAKYYFDQNYLVLPEGLSIGSDGERFEPGIDHPVYTKTLGLTVLGRWEDNIEHERLTLGDIIVDVSAKMEFE